MKPNPKRPQQALRLILEDSNNPYPSHEADAMYRLRLWEDACAHEELNADGDTGGLEGR